MKMSCPISTPTLNVNNASGISPRGNPISESALAKPKPCRRPNENATSQGRRAARLGLASATARDLASEQQNTERNGRLHRRTRHVHDAERRQRERDRVRQREGGDRRDQHPQVRHDEDQREHEQQMVVAEQDVLDAVHEVGARNGERPRAGGDLHPGQRGMDERRRTRAIARCDPHQNIGDRGLQAHEFDALAPEAAGRGDYPTLDDRVGQLVQPRFDEGVRTFGKLQKDRQAQASRSRACATRRRNGRAASRSARGRPAALRGRSRSGDAQGRRQAAIASNRPNDQRRVLRDHGADFMCRVDA